MTTSEATKKARSSKRKGSAFESGLTQTLREHGLEAERLHLNGKEDEGDLVVQDQWGKVIVEAKNEAKIDLARYVKEAFEEADNYVKHRGLDRQEVTAVAIVKARGKSILDSYVVTTVREYFDLDDPK